MSAITLRTNPPATYIPPTREEMKEAAKEVGLGSFSRDLVADLCNLAAGGSVKPPSAYRDEIVRRAEETLPAADYRGEWVLPKGGTTKNRGQAVTAQVEKAMRYHQNVTDFLGTVELDKFPGESPLEQAMNLLKLLSKKEGGQGGGEGGEPLPIFQENDNSEKVGQDLNQLMDDVESMSWDEASMLSPDKITENGDGDEEISSMDLAEDMLRGKDVMLEISRHLDKLTRMQVRKSKKQEPDPAGDSVRTRPIAHLGEMNRLVKPEWALPATYRLYRMVTHASQVRERVTTIEKKQLLYIIIDCSGSMGSGKRIFKAGGILMNRLKAVIAGEAELYVRLFDTSLREEHHASTPEEAQELIRHFTEKNYSGGSTDISGCARAAQQRIGEIEAQGSTYKPELVIVTDGDDKISLSAKEFSGTKLHAFVVDTKNDALCKLAQATGGVGMSDM
jgi:Mg-chelatase subunit ChlD